MHNIDAVVQAVPSAHGLFELFATDYAEHSSGHPFATYIAKVSAYLGFAICYPPTHLGENAPKGHISTPFGLLSSGSKYDPRLVNGSHVDTASGHSTAAAEPSAANARHSGPKAVKTPPLPDPQQKQKWSGHFGTGHLAHPTKTDQEQTSQQTAPPKDTNPNVTVSQASAAASLGTYVEGGGGFCAARAAAAAAAATNSSPPGLDVATHRLLPATLPNHTPAQAPTSPLSYYRDGGEPRNHHGVNGSEPGNGRHSPTNGRCPPWYYLQAAQ